ncbi:hypothetical protein [Sulfurimonas sp.]|uniref:hypothetical protein n=1 Tax=Sulfurimonas sp. TaxID=2022749 RepID=UPI003566D90E
MNCEDKLNLLLSTMDTVLTKVSSLETIVSDSVSNNGDTSVLDSIQADVQKIKTFLGLE